MKFSLLLNEFIILAIFQFIPRTNSIYFKLSTNTSKETPIIENINFLTSERYQGILKNQLVDQTILIFLRDIFADTRTKDGNNGTKITLLPLFNDGRDQ